MISRTCLRMEHEMISRTHGTLNLKNTQKNIYERLNLA